MPNYTGTTGPDPYIFPGLDGGETIDGLAGRDTLDGTGTRNDYLFDLENEVVSLTDGTHAATLRNFEVILAGSGNDRLISGIALGPYTLDGGAGDDTLSPGTPGILSGDSFAGGAGSDVLDFSGQTDDFTVDMNTGAFISGGANASISGFETIVAGSGDDFIREQTGVQSALFGGAGNDTLATADSGIGGGELFDGGSAFDTFDFSNLSDNYTANLETGSFGLTAGGVTATLINLEQVLAGSGDDLLFGGDGAQALFGNDGNDTLQGGNQEDTLDGGAGDDRMFGGTGFDSLWGGTGNDFMRGGGQADNLFGEDGDDSMYGDQGFDRLFGGDGEDLGFGGTGTDGLFGQAGDDRLYGQQDSDRIFGGVGNDLIDGGSDNDFLFGGAGFDTLVGGTGNDELAGNFNADTFIFADFGGGFGQDTITDFDATNPFERIDLSRVASITDLNDLQTNHMTQVGADVVIDALGGNTITLLNVNLGDLDATDFVF